MQDDQLPTNQTPPTPEPVETPVTPTVSSMPPMTAKKGNKGKMAIIIAILVILLVAAAYVISSREPKKDASTATTNSAQVAQVDESTNILDKIKSDAKAFSPIETEPGLANYVDHFTYKADNGVLLTIDPASLYVNYKTDGVKLFPSLQKIMTDNGLAEEKAKAYSSAAHSSGVYFSDLAACNLDATNFYARIMCVPKKTFDADKAFIPDVIAVANKKSGVSVDTYPVSDKTSVVFTISSDESLKGAIVGALSGSLTFLTNDGSGWALVGEYKITQSTSTIDCKVVNDAKYKNVFEGTGVTSSCVSK